MEKSEPQADQPQQAQAAPPLATPQQQQPLQAEQQTAPPQQQQQQQATNLSSSGVDPRSNKWQYGLFGCFGDGEACLIGCCFPCLLHGKTMDRTRDPSLQSHDPLNSECILFGGILLCTGCICFYNMIKRTEIREKYGIQGSGVADCCASYWCLHCAVIQQDREVALRAPFFAPVTQGYQPQTQGMHMPGPANPQPPAPVVAQQQPAPPPAPPLVVEPVVAAPPQQQQTGVQDAAVSQTTSAQLPEGQAGEKQ